MTRTASPTTVGSNAGSNTGSVTGNAGSNTGSGSKRYPKPRRGHWTVAEAARAWGLSTGWVRQLIARGRVVARLMTDAPSAYWAIDVDQPHPAKRKRTASGVTAERPA